MKVLTGDETIPIKEIMQLNALPSFKGSTSGLDKRFHKKVIVPGMKILLFISHYVFFQGN